VILFAAASAADAFGDFGVLERFATRIDIEVVSLCVVISASGRREPAMEAAAARALIAEALTP
jgi:hypothetical protein